MIPPPVRRCEQLISDGSHGGTFLKKPCGCQAIGEGTLPHPFTVKFCSLHENFMDLKEALEELVEAADNGNGVQSAIAHAKIVLDKIRR